MFEGGFGPGLNRPAERSMSAISACDDWRVKELRYDLRRGPDHRPKESGCQNDSYLFFNLFGDPVNRSRHRVQVNDTRGYDDSPLASKWTGQAT